MNKTIRIMEITTIIVWGVCCCISAAGGDINLVVGAVNMLAGIWLVVAGIIMLRK